MVRPRLPLGLAPGIFSRRRFLALSAGATAACGRRSSPTAPSGTNGRLPARPQALRTTLAGGPHELIGENGLSDGIIYVPRRAELTAPLPFAVMLHGGGGTAMRMEFTVDLAEEFGVALLLPSSRYRTWDAVVGPFGADATFINTALERVFAGCAIDPGRVAIGGLSDGATYALALGLLNGDLFTRIAAFSPGFLKQVDRFGRPRVFVSHGTRDVVLNIEIGGRAIVRQLQAEGYDVTYREFDGGHTLPEPIAREAFGWLSKV